VKYKVKVNRDGRWWMIEVPDLDVLSQARRLGEVERMARELIAVTTGSKIEGVEVDIELSDIGRVSAYRIHELDHEKDIVANLEKHIAQESQEVAAGLVEAGGPLRDIGEILGVSHQRVHQLVSHAH